MKRSIAVLALVAVAAPWAVLAAAPKTLKVVETVEVKAPVSKVWATVKDFDSLDKWHPGFAKDEIVKGTNNKVGRRTLAHRQGWPDVYGATARLQREVSFLQVQDH